MPSKTISDDLLLHHQPNLHELFGLYQFGQYMTGMGYVFTWDVIEFLSTSIIPPHQTWCEDVMVGMWLNPYQIHFLDLNTIPGYFMYSGPGDWNYNKKCVAAHYMREQDWNNIDDKGTLTK